MVYCPHKALEVDGMKKLRRGDILLIIALLAAALSVWLYTYLTRAESASVRVTVDGVAFGTYPLSEDTEVRIGDNTAYNILTIKDGEAWISEASCPDKLCVKQGKIEYDGQSVICLPNKVVVETVGGKASGEDAVAR